MRYRGLWILYFFCLFHCCKSISAQSEMRCSFKEEQIEIAIKILYNNEILTSENDTLRVSVLSDFELKDFTRFEVMHNDRLITISNQFESIPWVIFSIQENNKSVDVRKLYFRARDGHYYSGTISFKCYDGKLGYSDISYVDTVE